MAPLAMLSQPRMPTGDTGESACEQHLRVLLRDALRTSRKPAEVVAALMSEALGRDIRKHTIYSWTKDSDEKSRMPASHLPAFCNATGRYDVMDYLLSEMGCSLLVGDEIDDANLGRLQAQIDELNRLKDEQRHYMDNKRRFKEMMTLDESTIREGR